MREPSYHFTTEGAVKKIKEWLNGDYERWFNGPSYHEATLQYILQLEGELKEAKADSKRLDRLEEAYWFSLTTLPDGRKILKIQIHEDLIGCQPETGEMTVRELLDNEEPGLKMFEYLNAEDAEEDYQKTLDKLGENWQGEEQNHE